MRFLDIKNLSLKIKEKNILDNINLDIKSGEMICLVGPNGAGKSTLLKGICGILDKLDGEIIFKEKPLSTWDKKTRAREIALVSAFTPALNGFTMNDLFKFSRYPYMNIYRNLDKNEEKFKNTIIDKFNLQDFLDRDLSSLSSGEMQRILLACAFFQEPELLLVDEALSNLDPNYKIHFHKIFKEWIKENNSTLIYITHDLNEAFQLADKIIVMNAGRSVFCGNKKQLVENNILEEVYKIRFDILEKDGSQFIFPKGDLK